MEYLPTDTEQEWLVGELASLLASAGAQQFLGMPIVEPTPRFFPDTWSFSHQGLDRLVRRLMQYAGLGDLDVRVETYIELSGRNVRSPYHGGKTTAGLFMGIDDGQCLFGFNEQSPADAEYMAGVMAHEVAHAWRTHRGVVTEDRAEEECLTDLTTVYLGFGILSANNSFRFRTSGWSRGSLAYHSWSVQSAGYLTSQAFAFLLAHQMVARDLSPSQRGNLLRHLETDQAAFTKAALKIVWDREVPIDQLLRLPSERPSVMDPGEILKPLPAYVDAGPPVSARLKPAPFNEGRPVFRVPGNRVPQYLFLGLLIGGAVGIAGLVVAWWFFSLGVIVGATIGFLRGYRTRFEVCSDPACKALLTSAEACPNCGGWIAGTIKHRNDRLDAEESLLARKIRRTAVDQDDHAK